MGMDIDEFSGRNVDNYDSIRGCTITSNKMSSRTVSMSSSETLVNYTTKMKQLNNVPDKEETREPTDSSQLSYAEPKEIQVSKATNYENKVCIQQGNENVPALTSKQIQYVDDDVINIQLLYDPNTSTEPDL